MSRYKREPLPDDFREALRAARTPKDQRDTSRYSENARANENLDASRAQEFPGFITARATVEVQFDVDEFAFIERQMG